MIDFRIRWEQRKGNTKYNEIENVWLPSIKRRNGILRLELRKHIIKW